MGPRRDWFTGRVETGGQMRSLSFHQHRQNQILFVWEPNVVGVDHVSFIVDVGVGERSNVFSAEEEVLGLGGG